MIKKGLRLAILAVAVLGLSRPMSSAGQAGSVSEKLLGAWRLVSDEAQGADGKMVKWDQTGVLIYSRDGHMAVEIMDAPGAAADTGPVKYSQGGYEAYFGSFKVDETAHTVTHHVEGALVRSLIGKDLTRVYSFSGRQLILKSSRADEHWTIVWEHY